MSEIIRIATRESPLAMWQAEHVKAQLQKVNPDIQVELISMKTEGDRFLQAPLSTVGGKGLFIKELEQCLLDGKADIAVHSMKDVTVDFPEGLHLPVIMQREDPRDAFISNDYADLLRLPKGACVGTSSMRRQCQLRAIRPDLLIKDLRGNVNTRLRKLDEGQYDAIILATAGIKRLGFHDRIKEMIATDIMLPAIGQAAIGIECRSEDKRTLQILEPLRHEETAIRVEAERSLSRRLYGGCQLPIAAIATIVDRDGQGFLDMRALVGRVDGSELITDQIHGQISEGNSLGIELAEKLLAKGADIILEEILNEQQ